jgi:FkbM family methyltransferase
MEKQEFKIIGDLKYGDFPLIEYMINEIVVEDTYGLKNIDNLKIETIIDIGANLGVFSKFARQRFPKARIIALEAVSDTFLSLKENLKNDNIEIYNMALGDGSPLFLNQCKDHSGANQLNKTNIGEPIQSFKLWEIFEKLNINNSYMIKMDIEGSEMFLYEDKKSHKILNKSEYFTMEYHDVPMLGRHIHKPEWDLFLQNTFKNHEIKGLGGDKSITGATYQVRKK